MKKKTTAVILSLMMAGAFTAGCGQSSTGSDAASTEETAAAAETAAEAETGAAEDSSETASTEEASSEADSSQTEELSMEEKFPEAVQLARPDFLEEQTGKEEFASYDEIISLLENGQGYAIVQIEGADQEVLAVTDMTYAWDEDTAAAIDVSFYLPCGYIDGHPVLNIGNVSTGGTAYPVRLSDDGILYVCNNRTFSKLKVEMTGLLYYAEKTNLSYSEDGTATIEGFTSEDGGLSDAKPKTDVTTVDEFNAMFDDLDDVPILKFTKVVK